MARVQNARGSTTLETYNNNSSSNNGNKNWGLAYLTKNTAAVIDEDGQAMRFSFIDLSQ